MTTPTFEDVLAEAIQLPLADQERLRDALPVHSATEASTVNEPDAHANPFGDLIGIIDEEPQDHLTPFDQEIYGR